MQAAKDLCKKPIYRISDGQQLGEVRDFYLDPGVTQMIAVFLGKEGVFSRKTLVLPLRDIQLQGIDCWLCTPQAGPIDLTDWQGHESFVLVEDLRGRMIQTVHQFQIGTVKDVVFDEHGRVVAVDLAKVLVKGPLEQSKRIARAAIMSWGDKKTPIVADLDVAARAAGSLG
ncbi:MAG: PRC-barrel domain-containing protein [Pseudomonadota bacterium]